jgi:hypothetical protein
VSGLHTKRESALRDLLHDLWPDPSYLRSPVLETVPSLSVLLESAELLDFMPPNLWAVRTYTRRQRTRSASVSTPINSKLELPERLPTAVRDKALRMFTTLVQDDDDANDAAAKRELLIRLASDPRALTVWLELYKENRSPGRGTKKFFYKPSFQKIGAAHITRLTAVELRKQFKGLRDEFPEFPITSEPLVEFIERLPTIVYYPQPEEPVDPQARQDLAVQYLFHHAYLSALVEKSVVTGQEIASNFVGRTETAHRLFKEADSLRSFGMEREALELVRIAIACQDNVEILSDRWIVGRKRSDNRLRAYVITLAELTKKLFGKPLYGSLASLATVAFNLADAAGITDAQVREILRGPKHGIDRSGPP